MGQVSRWILGCVALLSAIAVDAQPPQFAYRIYFSDKKGSPPVANASSFLSARALARRTQQGIVTDSTDRPVSPLYLDTVVSLSQGKLHNASRWMNSCVLLLTDSSKMQLIRAKPYVLNTAWVGYFQNGLHKNASAGQESNSPGPLNAAKGTGTPSFYNNTWAQTTLVNGDYLHDNGYNGEGRLIAVIDLGFAGADTHHGFDSLRAGNQIVDAWNFITDVPNVYQFSQHGTETLSTMAGNLPDTFIGSARKAQYALYVTDDVNYTDALYETDNFLAAIERADSIGADIVSASEGYNEFTSPYYYIYPKTLLDGHTIDVSRAVNMATSKGMLAVIAAGNEGGNTWNFLLAPGDADSALTVGSVNTSKSPSGFSSPGPNSSGRIKPDVCALGEPAAIFFSGNTIGGGSGTSYSTPTIAGFAACLLQSHFAATPYLLRKAIIESADHFNSPGAQIGYGIPDFKKAFQSLGVDDIPGAKDPGELVVLPNPGSGAVAVLLPADASGIIYYSLADALGRRLINGSSRTANGNTLRLDLSPSLPAGIYYLKLLIGSKAFTAKISRL